MEKNDALEWSEKIKRGYSIAEDFQEYADNVEIGRIAYKLFNDLDPKFIYGIEHGVLFAIYKIFEEDPEKSQINE